MLRETTFTPLIAPLKRIDVTGMTRDEAAAHVVDRLKTPLETKERDRWRIGLPLPKVFNVLYRQNPNFTGRLDALESLQRGLREGNAAITALAGMGGVGKTTLAAEYCHRFGGRFGGVWWVRAEHEPVILTDLATLGQRLGITATGNIEADVRATLENLASRNEPWLMVYDNAPNADVVAKWLPAGAVRCLITSRFQGFDGIAHVTSLDQWSDEVTGEYLLVRTGRDDKDGALRLAHALDGLPLAAEQAAVFLKDRKGISFDDYAKDIARLIKEGRPAGAKGDYPDTVYAAFVKSLETLGEIKGGKTALDFVRLCAFLSPDGVDLDLLLIDKDGKILPSEFALATADTYAREDALAALASLSLLRQEDGPAGTVLIFHRLLLEVVRDWIGADARAMWGAAAVRLVGGTFPGDVSTNPSRWPLCARLMPHVAPLDAHAPRTGAAGKALDYLLNQACLYLAERGDRTGALALAEKSVALRRTTRTGEPLELAAGLNNLAGIYTDLDRLDDAEHAFKEVLEIAGEHLPNGDPRLATWTSNLAEVYYERKLFAEAEPLYLRAAEITKAANGENSAQYGIRLSNLGALYGGLADEPGQSARQADEEKYLTQALAVTRRARGTRHPDTATRHNNVAVMKEKRGDWAGAVAEMERAMAIRLSLDLAQHPHTHYSANALTSYWQQSGHPDKAARLAAGDISDLLPTIAQIEAEHRAWVAEDLENRHFGPPSPFAPSQEDVKQIRAALAKAGVDVDDLTRRVNAGELSREDAAKLVTGALRGKKRNSSEKPARKKTSKRRRISAEPRRP